jgi:Family of unknown function (DUF6600)
MTVGWGRWVARNESWVTRRARQVMIVALASALALSAARAHADEPQPAPPEPPAATNEPSPNASGRAPGAPAPGAPPANVEYTDTDPSALSEFSATLNPYGRWVQNPTYGYVWVPNPRVVGPDFGPYVTAGHWALTPDNQWIWVSDYPFGWVVFHYGRWVWVSGMGWAWVPGRRYAPAWVVWRVPDDGYDDIGWAPMPPTFVWFGGAVVWLSFGPPVPYVFCSTRYVFSPGLRGHLVARDRLAYVAAHTRHYHALGHAAWGGPSLAAAHVPARAVPHTRTPADPRALSAARRPAFGTAANRTRPEFRSPASAGSRPGPARAAPPTVAPARAGPRRARPRRAPVRGRPAAPHRR